MENSSICLFWVDCVIELQGVLKNVEEPRIIFKNHKVIFVNYGIFIIVIGNHYYSVLSMIKVTQY